MSISPLDKFIAQKKQYDDAIRKDGEKAFKAFLKDWFEKHPNVYGVKWTQYTPYFNDGDACVFGLGGVYSYKTKEAFESGDAPYDCDGAEEVYGRGTFEETLDSIVDILEAAFGDHVEVSATRDEITVDEYSHD